MEINAGYEIIQKFEFPDKPGEPKGQAIVIGKIPNQERYCTWYYNDVGKYNYGIYDFASYEKAYKDMMKRIAEHLLDNNQLQEILTQTLTQTKIIKEIKETANSFLEDAAKSQKGDPSVIRWDGNAIEWLNNAVDVIESILAETEKKLEA